MALIRAHIRLGIHPRCWKIARGVAIPRPGKEDYDLAKSYRVISLLNCLGKIVEKVATMLVCSGPYADPGHPRMARAIHGWPGSAHGPEQVSSHREATGRFPRASMDVG